MSLKKIGKKKIGKKPSRTGIHAAARKRPEPSSMDGVPSEARKWLRHYGYTEVADIIDLIMEQWEHKRNGARKNWWMLLSGDKNGAHRTIAGYQLPVLAAAQIRQGKSVSPWAIPLGKGESVPPIRKTNRWL